MDSLEARALGTRLLAPVSPTPALDCRVLLCHALGTTVERLFAEDRELSAEEERLFLSLLERRAAGLSVAAATGRKEFYGRTFAVSPDVLVPRPETETLVEKAVGLALGRARERRLEEVRVLDVCCGSGCVGISVKAELEARGLRCRLWMGDISPAAVAIARKNCGQILPDGAKCIVSDLFEAFGGLKFDIVTANPPYIAGWRRGSLSREVLSEPEAALFSGEDGLDLTRRIVREAPPHLGAGGHLVLECGADQAWAAKRLLEAAGFAECFVADDLGGLPRCAGGHLDA